MKEPANYWLFLSICLFLSTMGSSVPAEVQAASTPVDVPLVLIGSFALHGVKGRMDHFAFDPNAGRLFVSALGNNTAEVIDISAGRVIPTITGIIKPQGTAFSPDLNKLFVASDEGKVYIYDGTSFAPLGSVDFGDDADNLRYDPGVDPLAGTTG
jgi:DNA-binding beta-propeller fold protein YncE